MGRLKDFENNNIKVYLLTLKLFEACIIFTVGIIHVIIANNLGIKVANICYGLDINDVFMYLYIGFMVNALLHITERISPVILLFFLIKPGKFKTTMLILCCPVFVFDFLLKVYVTIARWLSLDECFWKVKSKISRIIMFKIRLIVYLFGLSLTIATLVIYLSGKNTNIKKSISNLLATNIVFFCLRIVIMMFLFKFCTLFNPSTIEKTHTNHDGFLRLEELNSSTCAAGFVCATSDLEHVLKCHNQLHKPIRKCNICYLFTCRSNYFIGFHQTTPKNALKIAQDGFKCGNGGKYGGGIYFARSIDMTDRKAHANGAVICALVDTGKRYIPVAPSKATNSDRLAYLNSLNYITANGKAKATKPNIPSIRYNSITLSYLNSLGYDSTYAKAGISGVSSDEFVVYEPERVKKWIICFPSKHVSTTRVNVFTI